MIPRRYLVYTRVIPYGIRKLPNSIRFMSGHYQGYILIQTKWYLGGYLAKWTRYLFVVSSVATWKCALRAWVLAHRRTVTNLLPYCAFVTDLQPEHNSIPLTSLAGNCRIAGWISLFSDPPSCSLNVSLPPWNQIERGRSVQSRKHAGCDGSEMPG